MRQKCRLAVHLILQRNDEVLLSCRSNTGYEDGNFSVPAGNVDGRETAIEAMVREAKEEVGLVIQPASLQLAHVMHRTAEADVWICMFFLCEWRTEMGEPYNAEPEKCSQLLWSYVPALPSNVVPYVRMALLNSANGEIYSES